LTLHGRVAVVTGSSRGIGRTIALTLAEQGADIAIVYRSDQSAALTLKAQIEALQRKAIVVQADVTVPDDVDRLIQTACDQLGSISILVNNVGEFALKPLGMLGYEEWDDILKSNLHSVFYCCRATLQQMRQQKWGRIINIGLSPMWQARGAPNITAYAVAKMGVLVLTKSLAIEEAPHGITVNCVSPGLIDNGYLPPEQHHWMLKRVPMGRLGQAEDVAAAIQFLVSEQASYISGANLAVSGAWDWEDRLTNHDGDVHSLFIGEQ